MNFLQRLLSWLLGSRARMADGGSARKEPRPPEAARGGLREGEPPGAPREGARTVPRPPGDGGPGAAAWPEFQPEIPHTSKKVGRPLGLDASDYLPIPRAEIKVAARGRNLLGNPWFGRRDLIPPADDPRTQLIDRAMVTQGLITPEQLAEIHAVGAEMDRVRPTVASIEHQAAMTGEAAVQADGAARARLKAQKKAEAAERKQQKSEAIAWRK